MRTMNVSLPEALEAYVNRLVETGTYTSASEVVREGLRLLQQRNAAAQILRAEVQEGLAELDRGQGSKLEDVARRIRARRKRPAKRTR